MDGVVLPHNLSPVRGLQVPYDVLTAAEVYRLARHRIDLDVVVIVVVVVDVGFGLAHREPPDPPPHLNRYRPVCPTPSRTPRPAFINRPKMALSRCHGVALDAR